MHDRDFCVRSDDELVEWMRAIQTTHLECAFAPFGPDLSLSLASAVDSADDCDGDGDTTAEEGMTCCDDDEEEEDHGNGEEAKRLDGGSESNNTNATNSNRNGAGTVRMCGGGVRTLFWGVRASAQ
jgi:hypothetical protein